MRKLFWLFMMLLLAGCGSGGGTPAANSPSASGKGVLSLELVQSETRVAKTVADALPAAPGRYRIVLTETTSHYKEVVDRAFGEETLVSIQLPVGTYKVEAILYESGTPNVLTQFGTYKVNGSLANVTIGADTNTIAALTMEDIAVVMPTPTPEVFSGEGYVVGAIAPADLAAKGLGEKWSLTSSTSPFAGRKHLSQPATDTHTGLTAPTVGVSGTLYFQGEFFMKADLLDAGESANNWAFFTEEEADLTVPALTIPVNFIGSLPNDTQAPVVKAFNVPSAKQPEEDVSEISIVGADNGGIKEYAITTTTEPFTGTALAEMTAPTTGWSTAPSFRFSGTVGSTDQTVYVYAWVRDFANLPSSQVDGVTNRKIVFNNSPVVTSFTVPSTTVMDSDSIPVTIVGKGYQTQSDLWCRITETATKPSATDPIATNPSEGWTPMTASTEAGAASFTTNYNALFTQAIGVRYNVSLYAWVKDGNNNVSLYALRKVTVNDSPQITALAATGGATGSTVTITRLEVSTFPDRYIVGYRLTPTSTKPAADAYFTPWDGVGVPSPLPSYTFTGITATTPITRAIYVWVKDNEGAISALRGGNVVLTPPFN